MGLQSCFFYFCFTGIFSFFLGRILPKKWFNADSFPYRSFKFEESGILYDKLKIHKWKTKVPDMSKVFPKVIPEKRLYKDYQKRVPLMLRETCIAEFIHIALCVSGLYCMILYPGIGGKIVYLIYVFVFNLPYILIQRYNRPRLMRLACRLKEKKGSEDLSQIAVKSDLVGDGAEEVLYEHQKTNG